MALKAKAFSIIRFRDTQVPVRWATRPGQPGPDTCCVPSRACGGYLLEVSTSMEANSSTLDFLLHDVARLLRKRFEQNARGSGLTRSQWQVLTYLAQNGGINQSGLAELLDVEQITLCRIVDRHQAFGLIERHPHPSDRRVRILHLTPTAHLKLIQARKLGDMTRSEVLARVSDIDGLHLLETLQALKLNLTDACDSSVAGHKRVTHG
jgi:MarR family transcriptional regulator, transcriptional regulator for hemolysin